jgi:hypothetical protein
MSGDTMPDLEAVTRERGGRAYIVTVSDQGGPHTVHVPVRWDRGELVAEVGTGTAANAAARPQVSILYPVRSAEDYSLIVDGRAALEPGEARRVRVTPTKIVLHRPDPPLDRVTSCAQDCVPIALPLSIGQR